MFYYGRLLPAAPIIFTKKSEFKGLVTVVVIVSKKHLFNYPRWRRPSLLDLAFSFLVVFFLGYTLLVRDNDECFQRQVSIWHDALSSRKTLTSKIFCAHLKTV